MTKVAYFKYEIRIPEAPKSPMFKSEIKLTARHIPLVCMELRRILKHLESKHEKQSYVETEEVEKDGTN